MPTVFGSSDPLKDRTVLHGGNATILRIFTHTDIYRAAAAHDTYLPIRRTLRFGYFGFGRGTLPNRRQLQKTLRAILESQEETRLENYKKSFTFLRGHEDGLEIGRASCRERV